MNATVTDPAILEAFLTDASNVHGHADALVRPRSAQEVAEVVRHCQAHEIPLTVSAARTSTTAAPVPFGGWVLSMEGLTRIHEITEGQATADAGVILGQLQTEVEARGRLFPPDPTSRNECTLGAAIACNASGARTFRYGATRAWVEALEVVLPTGEVRTFRRGDPVPPDWPIPDWQPPRVKSAAGYVPPGDALDLFIGQEGTLGVITRATVRLTALPHEVLGVLAYFASRQEAVAFVRRAREAAQERPHGPLSPRALEYLDQHCLDLARERMGEVPEGATAALLCEQEVHADIGEEAHLEAWWTSLEEADALMEDVVVATDPGGQAELHALRHAVPAGINERVIQNRMPKVGTDLAVPDAHLDEMMDAYEAAPLEHVLFGHIGDNHLHLNLLPKTDDELATARAYYRSLAERAVAVGGTISAEHGVGKVKKDLLPLMVPADALERFRALKAKLDPAWILGRGTLFDRR